MNPSARQSNTADADDQFSPAAPRCIITEIRTSNGTKAISRVCVRRLPRQVFVKAELCKHLGVKSVYYQPDVVNPQSLKLFSDLYAAPNAGWFGVNHNQRSDRQALRLLQSPLPMPAGESIITKSKSFLIESTSSLNTSGLSSFSVSKGAAIRYRLSLFLLCKLRPKMNSCRKPRPKRQIKYPAPYQALYQDLAYRSRSQ